MSTQLLEPQATDDHEDEDEFEARPRRRRWPVVVGVAVVAALAATAATGVGMAMSERAKVAELQQAERIHAAAISKLTSDLGAAVVALRTVGSNGISNLGSRLDDLESKVDDVDSRSDCLDESLSAVGRIWGDSSYRYIYRGC